MPFQIVHLFSYEKVLKSWTMAVKNLSCFWTKWDSPFALKFGKDEMEEKTDFCWVNFFCLGKPGMKTEQVQEQ